MTYHPPFANGEIYHLYNRGVEKRNVFLEKKDYLRFVHDLYEFNDTHPAPVSNVRFSLMKPSQIRPEQLIQLLEVEPPKVGYQQTPRRKRKFLVEILAFCLMPNHYHLLVRQHISNGIVRFMQKLGTGYTMYFNEKNKRVGSLFQGRYKAVLITEDVHFTYIPHYIHLNPLDLVSKQWREGKVKNTHKALNFLCNYRWSSFPDYIGQKNFPSVTQREYLHDFLGEPDEYKQATWRMLKEMKPLSIADTIPE